MRKNVDDGLTLRPMTPKQATEGIVFAIAARNCWDDVLSASETRFGVSKVEAGALGVPVPHKSTYLSSYRYLYLS